MGKKKKKKWMLPLLVLPFISLLLLVAIVGAAIEAPKRAVTNFFKTLLGIDAGVDQDKIDEWYTNYSVSYKNYPLSEYKNKGMAMAIHFRKAMYDRDFLSGVDLDSYMTIFASDDDYETIKKVVSERYGVSFSGDDDEAILAMKDRFPSMPNPGDDTTTINVESDGTVAGDAMAFAIAIANDDTIGYSQTYRYSGHAYDCSSLVTYAYIHAGINLPATCWTGNMETQYTAAGFVYIPYTGMADLQPGDVLVVHASYTQHTEMYLGNGQLVGARTDYGDSYPGITDDINGREIEISGFYEDGWQYVLRYPGNKD